MGSGGGIFDGIGKLLSGLFGGGGGLMQNGAGTQTGTPGGSGSGSGGGGLNILGNALGSFAGSLVGGMIFPLPTPDARNLQQAPNSAVQRNLQQPLNPIVHYIDVGGLNDPSNNYLPDNLKYATAQVQVPIVEELVNLIFGGAAGGTGLLPPTDWITPMCRAIKEKAQEILEEEQSESFRITTQIILPALIERLLSKGGANRNIWPDQYAKPNPKLIDWNLGDQELADGITGKDVPKGPTTPNNLIKKWFRDKRPKK